MVVEKQTLRKAPKITELGVFLFVSLFVFRIITLYSQHLPVLNQEYLIHFLKNQHRRQNREWHNVYTQV